MPSQRLQNPYRQSMYADPLAQSANAIADLMFSQKSPNDLAKEQLAGDVARANIEQSRAATAHSAAQTGKIASDQARQGGALGDYIAALTSGLDDTQPGLIQKAQQFAPQVVDAKKVFALSNASPGGDTSINLANAIKSLGDQQFVRDIQSGATPLPTVVPHAAAERAVKGEPMFDFNANNTGNYSTGESLPTALGQARAAAGSSTSVAHLNPLMARMERDIKPLNDAQLVGNEIRSLFDSGQAVATAQVQQLLTQYLGKARMTNKLYADNKSFGNFEQRLVNMVSRFASGKYSDDDRKQVLNMVDSMDKTFFSPARKNVETKYQKQLKLMGGDPSFADTSNIYGGLPDVTQPQPAAKPAANAGKYKVGETIQVGNTTVRVVGHDSDGEPLVE